MFVQYIGGMDFHDGLTTGQIYKVIGENERQYIVNNNLGATSKIQKDKFDVIVVDKTIVDNISQEDYEKIKALEEINEIDELARTMLQYQDYVKVANKIIKIKFLLRER